MRLCILSDASSYHTKRWVDWFAKRGWETHLISLERPIQKTEGIEHILYSIPGPLKYIWASKRVKGVIKEIKPDIVNGHFVPNYGLLGVISGYRPLIVNCWGSDILISAKRSILHKMRAVYILKRADIIIVDAEMLKEEILEWGIKRERILVIPMGVDTDIFRLKEFPESQDIYRVIHYRPLEPLYNPLPIIRAVPLVEERLNNRVRFIIQKRGSLYPEIDRLSHKLGIEGFLYLFGRVDHPHLSRLLRRCDIYISLSTSDSTSVSLLEAMASGLFPIVSDIKGNREWIRDGENGFLVPLYDEKVLSLRIVEALRDRELRMRAAELNRRIVEERADWKRNMEMVERVFLRFLQLH